VEDEYMGMMVLVKMKETNLEITTSCTAFVANWFLAIALGFPGRRL